MERLAFGKCGPILTAFESGRDSVGVKIASGKPVVLDHFVPLFAKSGTQRLLIDGEGLRNEGVCPFREGVGGLVEPRKPLDKCALVRVRID